jgi:hypothetical protein
MMQQYFATKPWINRFLAILNTLMVTIFQKTSMTLSRISITPLENPHAHFFVVSSHYWIERRKWPLPTKFQSAAGLHSGSNQGNTSKFSEKWEN